jgi:hypothetical protein
MSEDAGSKAKTANELEIKTLSEVEFLDLIQNNILINTSFIQRFLSFLIRNFHRLTCQKSHLYTYILII